MSFKINNKYIHPLVEPKEKINPRPKPQQSFKNILNQEVSQNKQDIKVSGHANRRLIERNISLDEKDLKTLGQAMDKAGKKGAKESLMFYKDVAFIASIRNRTLITAMDPKNSEEKIFTNIDSAVFVD